ncbi:MAG: hypothetical protein ACI9GM_000707 [Salibacteraceae bacterium]|jgi:hypothetical protein
MKNILLWVLLGCVFMGNAQEEQEFSIPEYTLTIDGIVNEGLAIVTGERGKQRDWEAFRMLFDVDAKISVVNHDSLGNAILRVYSLSQFVRLGMRFYETDGFIEYEISSRVEEYNGMASVFQGYYAKELGFEEKGVNMYQLFHDGQRWWITSLVWTNDRNGIMLPKKYDGPLK